MDEQKEAGANKNAKSISALRPELVIGARVAVKTISNDKVEGEVFTLDDKTGILVLSESLKHTTLKKELRFISFAAVEEIEVTKPSDGASLSKLQPISEEQLLRAEQRNLAARREANSRIGVGVTPEAQEIFDALSKTLPCRWDEQNIIVLNSVTIRTPYNAENCSSSDVNALKRIRLVLEGAKKKMVQQRKASAK